MITVPVLIDFDNQNPIGYMVIDEKKLPIIADYSFTIGLKITNKELNGLITNAELVSVSIVHNMEHLKYLESKYGKL